MKFLKLIPLFCLASTSVIAEEYTVFGDLNYTHSKDSDNTNTDASNNYYSASTIYFFKPKQSLGPLNEFEYINHSSYIGGNIFKARDDYSFQVGAGYINDKIAVRGSYTNNDDFENWFGSASLGYFFTENFILSLSAHDSKNSEDTDYDVSAQYNYNLNSADYIGFSAVVADEENLHSLSSRYFNALDNGHYLSLGGSYASSDFYDSWGFGGNYYFSRFTGVGLGYSHSSSEFSESNSFSANIIHYFNLNWSLSLDYSKSDFDYEYQTEFFDNFGDTETDTYSLELRMQF